MSVKISSSTFGSGGEGLDKLSIDGRMVGGSEDFTIMPVDPTRSVDCKRPIADMVLNVNKLKKAEVIIFWFCMSPQGVGF